MAVGTPVVATDCPSGPAEILEGGKWGLLTPVGDDQALAAAILATFREGSKGHEELQNRVKIFTLGNIVEKYLEVINIG